MSEFSSARKRTRHLMTFIVPAVLLSICVSERIQAQGLIEKVTKAARGFTSVTTEAGMIGAATLDLETRNLPAVNVGEVTVGVSQVDFKPSVGVRVHLYYLNSTDQPVTITAPNDQTFALVDAKGRRLVFLALRFQDLPKGAASLIVPALERIAMTALFTLPAGVSGEAILKIGTAGMIRGIPVGDDQTSAPALTTTPNPGSAAAPPPASPPPADSTQIKGVV